MESWQSGLMSPRGRFAKFNTMYYMYILKSSKRNWFYVGSTSDLKRRFGEHNNGESRSTKGYIPLDLVYYEAYCNYKIAKQREYYIKHNSKAKEELLDRIK